MRYSEAVLRARHDAVEIVRRLLETSATRDGIAVEYGCGREVVSTIYRAATSVEERAAAARRKLSEQKMGVKTGRVPAHAFKAGEIRGLAARRYLPVGSIRIRIRADGRQNKWIKVADEVGARAGNWRSHAEYVWERVNGRPVPDGCRIAHRDLDSLNDDPDNLECVTLAQRLARAQSLPGVRAKRIAKVVRSIYRRAEAVRERKKVDAERATSLPVLRPAPPMDAKAKAAANIAAFLREVAA